MIRTVEFKYQVTRNGAIYTELQTAEGAYPQIQMKSSDAIQTVFNGTFQLPKREVDWLTDEIRPAIIIDGVRHNLGVFLPANVHSIFDGTVESIAVTANDRCWIPKDYRAERIVYFQAGTNYVEAVASLLAESGITMINETPTDEVMTEDREDWDIGTSYLDIINGLLAEINYAPLWFDSDGIAVIEPVSVPTAINMDHMLDETKVESLLIPGRQNETNLYSTPNVFICCCNNPDKSGAMTAVAENTNPQSPLSIARRGRRITKMIRVNNIPSQEALQAYANRQVTDSMLTGEVITVNTCLLPGFGVWDVTGIRYRDLLAVCKETAWSMELKVGGRMSHTLERAVMNLG